MILTFIWRGKNHKIPNIVLKEKNKFGGLILLYFKAYYKAKVIRTVGIGKKKEKKCSNKSMEHNKEPRNMLPQI